MGEAVVESTGASDYIAIGNYLRMESTWGCAVAIGK